MTNVEKIQVGSNQVAFVRKSGDVIWPEYAGHEDLVLWYDFMGRTNSDTKRATAEDLSGNGNNATLQNFAYTDESGYDDGLMFDGVDDYVQGNEEFKYNSSNFTLDVVVVDLSDGSQNIYSPILSMGDARNWITYRRGVGIYVYVENTLFNFSPISLPVTSTTNAYSITFESNKISLYINGTLYSTITQPYTVVQSINPGSLGVRGIIYGNIRINSFRKYSRLLTPSEIQTNYLIDKQRFNLP